MIEFSSKRTIRNGFLLVNLCILLPVLISMLGGLSFILTFLKLEYAVKNQCRVKSLNLEDAISQNIESLFSLNPEATRLRLELEIAKSNYQTALATRLPPLIAIALMKLQRVQADQIALDVNQKRLIKNADVQIQIALNKTERDINRTLTFTKMAIRPFYELKFNSFSFPSPGLSVRPNDFQIAPTYSLSLDFERNQTIRHVWNFELKPLSWLKNFGQKTQSFRETCAATLKSTLYGRIPTLVEGPATWR